MTGADARDLRTDSGTSPATGALSLEDLSQGRLPELKTDEDIRRCILLLVEGIRNAGLSQTDAPWLASIEALVATDATGGATGTSPTQIGQSMGTTLTQMGQFVADLAPQLKLSTQLAVELSPGPTSPWNLEPALHNLSTLLKTLGGHR